MKKIGITGGVGSGKSKVLEYLSEKEGVAIYQADLLAHEVQRPGNSCYEEICAYFGEEILAEDGEIDRKKLGAIVFSDEEKLLTLNQMVHPAVEARVVELAEAEERAGCKWFILEAALLHQCFYREFLDEIWFVHTEESVRRERLKASRNYTDEKITSMIKSQPSEAVFREISSRIIENSADFSETMEQLNEAMKIEK